MYLSIGKKSVKQARIYIDGVVDIYIYSSLLLHFLFIKQNKGETHKENYFLVKTME